MLNTKCLFLLNKIQFGKKSLNDILVLTYFIVCILIACFYYNRSFIFSYIVVLIWLISYIKRKRLVNMSIFFLIILTVLSFLILVKLDSSLGRLLVYKITFTMFEDHWLHGLGFGRFKMEYLHYQASYFKAGHFSQKELLLADNTQYAFNDYWQFILEMGIKGFFIIIILLGSIFHIISKALINNDKKSSILLIAICQLLTIIIAALFTHVFEMFSFQILLILCITIISKYAYLQRNHLIYFVSIILILFTVQVHFGFVIKNYRFYQKLKYIENLHKAGFVKESLIGYKELYPIMKSDAYYLINYSMALSNSEGSIEAENLVRRALSLQCNNVVYKRFGDCLYNNGKITAAETAYIDAVYMVPNRILPRYHLYNFYKKTKQIHKAMVIKKQILSLPIKVPSPIINRIKQELIKDR